MEVPADRLRDRRPGRRPGAADLDHGQIEQVEANG
jgi:hypothetical protein